MDKIEKLCISENGKGYWIQTHYRFLRKDDTVRKFFEDNTGSGPLLVVSDPYIDKEGKWTVDVDTTAITYKVEENHKEEIDDITA